MFPCTALAVARLFVFRFISPLTVWAMPSSCPCKKIELFTLQIAEKVKYGESNLKVKEKILGKNN